MMGDGQGVDGDGAIVERFCTLYVRDCGAQKLIS